MKIDFSNENIWIIGASSGIGKELAIRLSDLGANLILSARNVDNLQKLQKQLNKKHKIYAFDVSNYKQMQNVFKKLISNSQKIDRVIFMSAIYKPDNIYDMDLDFAMKIVDVNFKSVLSLVKNILPIFEQQKSGQIILCASVASYIGLPNGQPYSATKAAMVNFAESLYTETPEYIDVKVINPGFVQTPMTAKNTFKMPMIIKAQEAAKIIVNNLNKNKFEIHFPWKFTFILKFLAILPYKIKLFITKKI